MELSVLGGGGMIIQPYQSVTSEAYSISYPNAMTLPSGNNSYEFPGTSSKSQFSARLDVSSSDPDLNDDGTYNDYGKIAATMTNGRLRLHGRSTINGTTFEYENGSNGDMPTLRSESPLFNITPASNFTIRVLLEGYHTGIGATGKIENDLGTTYSDKGVRITLYSDNANTPGVQIATAESTYGYSNDATGLDPNSGVGRGNDGSEFANVPFIFTDISDGDYFVVVEHLNHLPVMSAYAAPFYYSGDDVSTWDIESGWDFQTWDGVANNTITDAEASTTPPTFGTNFTAYGNAETDESKTEYASTALIYNEGRAGKTGTTASYVSSMVGGDVYKDGQINAADRAQVRLDEGGSNKSSDVTGDGNIDATDRTIVDRNTNKVSSLTNLDVINKFDDGTEEEGPMLDYIVSDDPMTIVHPDARLMSERLIENAREYLEKGGEYNHNGIRVDKYAKDVVLNGVRYRVWATPILKGEYIEIPFYMQNQGSKFALANCTFAIDYDPSALNFVELVKENDIIFDSRPDLGYGKLTSAPKEETVDPIPYIRTIEIDYDAYAEKPGQILPNDQTYIGTLKFKIIQPLTQFNFDWYNVAVHTTDGRIITDDGTFEPIPPVMIGENASILVPNGGETWRAGKLYTIQWSEPNSEGFVYLEFSMDGGKTWDKINPNPVDIMQKSYNWLTPKVNSTECLIRMVDANSGVEIDRSNASFILEPAPIEITRPNSSDGIYEGGTSDFIVWEANETIDIRFEFSENGLDNWMPVTGTINSQMGQTDWVIPATNTKYATVRMVDVKTNQVLATSEPFKILAGMVTITHPRFEEILNSGKEKAVRWTYDNVSRFDLQWSPDGGSSWETVSRDVNAMKSHYIWVVPEVKTDNAYVRAIWNNDPEMEYSRSEKFRIDGKVAVEDLENLGYVFESPMPNPFNDVTELTFTLPVAQRVTIDVLNQTGQRVKRLVDGMNYQAGSHNISLEGNNLPSGMYIIVLNAGSYTMTQEVVLIK
jgi:hypothetical protein